MEWRRKVLALAGAIVAFGLSSGAFANGPGSGGGGGGPGSGRGAMGGPSAPGGRDTSSSRGVSGMPGAGSPRAPESVPDRGTGPRDADRGAVPPPGGDGDGAWLVLEQPAGEVAAGPRGESGHLDGGPGTLAVAEGPHQQERCLVVRDEVLGDGRLVVRGVEHIGHQVSDLLAFF